MQPESSDSWESLRDKIIGLGELSVHKSYYPELQQQLVELKRFRALLDQSNDIIFLLDVPSGIIMDVNKSGSDLLEYSNQEMLKMPIINLIPSSKVNKIDKMFLDLDRSKGDRKTITTTFVKKSGYEISVESSISFVEFGNVLYAVMVSRDITERNEAEKQIKQSLNEKEVLLKEIHHRVKNNLQIISSLLNLQSASLDDKDSFEVFKESQNRIKSMALIHEKLYQSRDLARIDFAEYIKSLVYYLFQSYSVDLNVIKPILNVEDILFDIDISIPCGLIINEIISNSLKYAFPDGKTGEIIIDLHLYGKKAILTVSDTGIGLPEHISLQNTETLGLRLIDTLVSQIDGKIELDKTKGTSFKIEFIKKSSYKQRI
ncbi:MAG: PAS domain S-box protein [Methanobacterium sp.]|uniref:sensor histidine kinase n=1 Tax=Methanobacterium sp. TaxID=2164 RepID=UPI003D6585D5|nr:PAS domain S-box protein [Methanobacterium sp.]